MDPWRITHGFLGDAASTFVVNFFYNSWMYVMIGVLYWQLFSLRDPKLRMQFFYSYFLCWTIIGVLFAILLSSAGPCFYAGIVEATDPYQPLMQRLQEIDAQYAVWALDTQQLLWDNYANSSTGFGSGISAMPSMHVSMAFLFFLVGWRTHPAAAIAFGLYAMMVLVGSVHLGWHYAVDGYAGLVLTVLVWLAAGRLCDALMHGAPREAVPAAANGFV
jgi:membrane-associated phospholipid phosphatase